MIDESVVGIIERIIYKNQENGYHVLDVKLNNGKNYTIVGNHVKLHEGITMEFVGQWITNPKFGKQFKAKQITEKAPETKEAIIKYLSSSFFKGIGPVIAKKVVKHLGENTLHILKTDIDKLSEVPGISKKKISVIKKAWLINSEINEIMVFLQSYNISTLFAVKIYETYGHDCINKIKKNPYKLADDIKGVGFKYADNIALDLGFEKNSKERISAAIKYVLSQSETQGHCYLFKEQIIETATKLLEVKVEEYVVPILNKLIEENEIKFLEIDNIYRYYSINLYYNEKYCANKIAVLNKNNPIYNPHTIEKWFEDLNEDDIKLSKEQKEAIQNIVNNGVSVLTGGPGCGKTTTLKYLVKLLKHLKVDYTLASPTGRAAQRMSEVIGSEASTIHRLLGWDHASGQFIHNEENQLNTEFVIIDESSMIDINIASHLLRAIPKDTQIVFIGDVDQLPPVGPGHFFKDLINSELIAITFLNKIFRQAESSHIVQYAHEINKGKDVDVYSPLINPEIWRKKIDCMFIDSDLSNPYKTFRDYPNWSSLYYDIDAINMIKNLYTTTIHKYFGENKEIQILSPMNVGDLGTERINEVIQDTVNPKTEDKKEIKIRQKIFREGDRVIQMQNNYDLGIFNGTIGKITNIDVEKTECDVQFFSEHSEVHYKRDQMLELKLAYCITIHKSQGSEFPIIIIPLINQHYRMLYRNLIYTGLTRAKELCVFVGQRSAFSHAIKNIKTIKRQTSFMELLELKK